MNIIENKVPPIQECVGVGDLPPKRVQDKVRGLIRKNYDS